MSQRGFTLVELLVTVAIVAILAMIAIPSFNDFLVNTRITTDANNLVAELMFARSEAVKRGVPVTVCPSSDGAKCMEAGSVDWNGARIVFVDRATRGTVDAGSDSILRTGSPLRSTALTFSAANDYLSFSSDGSGFPQGSLTITACKTNYVGRIISLTSSGRITNAMTTGTCS